MVKNNTAKRNGYCPSFNETFFGNSNKQRIAKEVIPTPQSKVVNSSNRLPRINYFNLQEAGNLTDQLNQDIHLPFYK